MKLKPKDFLDFSVVIAGLLLTSLVISGLDEFESRTTASRTVSIAPWHAEPPPRGSLERDYLVMRNSVRRWVFFYFPSLSLIGGAAVGIACSGWRRAWILAILATAAVPVTAAGLLLLYPGSAVVGSLAYVAVAGASGTASGWFLDRRNGQQPTSQSAVEPRLASRSGPGDGSDSRTDSPTVRLEPPPRP